MWILKQLRKTKGKTVEDMSLLLDMEPNEYVYCENRPYEFDLTQAYKISKLLGVDFSEINWTEDIEVELERRNRL